AYYARRKEFFKAAEEMRAIALTYREDAVAYQQWARFALRAGGYAVAHRALELALHCAPDASSAKMLGDIELAEGNYASAESRYRTALALSPPHAIEVQARYARALALLKLGQRDACIEELQTVLRLDPRNRDARALLSQFHLPAPQQPQGP
ncbi:MAG TPA: tetratricopeptide repeat protein, partial [Bacteroidota bacterium]|nr:tetratricopeptide repeat protein [Bacteroidota bacterium]